MRLLASEVTIKELKLLSNNQLAKIRGLIKLVSSKVEDPELGLSEARDLLKSQNRALARILKQESVVEPTDDVVELFNYWRTQCGYAEARLTEGRRRILAARLQSYPMEVLKQVVDFGANDPWLSGTDTRSTRRYNGIETLFSSDDKVEKYKGQRAAPKATWNPNDTDYRSELL